MSGRRLAARTLVLGLALSAGSLACALVAGLEDKEPYALGDEAGSSGMNEAGPGADGAVANDGALTDADGGLGITSEVFATAQAGPWGIAIDESYVYWTNEGDSTIVRAPKGGGPPAVIAREQLQAHDIVVDPTNVIWQNANPQNLKNADSGAMVYELARIAKAAIPGGAPIVRIEDLRTGDKVRGMAIAATPDNQLWVTWTDKLRRNRRDEQANGKDAVKDLDMQVPTAVAVDDVYAYWFLQQPLQIWRIAKTFDAPGSDAGAGNVIATLSGAPEVDEMVSDGTALYMVTKAGAVLKVPAPAGGAAVSLATGHPFPRSIAVDDKYVYFTRTTATDAANEGMVVMVAKSGADTKVIAQGQNKPRGIAIDVGLDGSHTVYWATSGDGTIHRAKLR